MIAATLLCAALAAAPAPPDGAAGALAEDPSPGEMPRRDLSGPTGPLQLRIAFLPLASYGSNVGLQVGAALLFYKTPPGGGPRRDWLAVGASWATRGPRSLEVKGESIGLFSTPMRAFYQAKYSTDDQAPYWGEGARLAPGDSPGAGSPPDPYRYRAVGPWLSVLARAPVASPTGPWWVFGRVRFRQLEVSDPGAALLAAAPPGAHGGTLTALHAGVLRDTRDEEISPSRGTFADASVFAAPPGLSSNAMWGVNAAIRRYVPLAPRVVLAARALYELKLGDVPFSERSQLEGINSGEGLGGPGTIRGLARARLSGEEKALANVELRTVVATFRPGGRPLELGLSAGADAGSARQRGHSALTAAGVFGGLRAIWDRALVVRLESGWAAQGSPAYYLAFDESF